MPIPTFPGMDCEMMDLKAGKDVLILATAYLKKY